MDIASAAILVVMTCTPEGVCEEAPEAEIEFASTAQCEAALAEYRAEAPKGVTLDGECLVVTYVEPDEPERMVSDAADAIAPGKKDRLKRS